MKTMQYNRTETVDHSTPYNFASRPAKTPVALLAAIGIWAVASLTSNAAFVITDITGFLFQPVNILADASTGNGSMESGTSNFSAVTDIALSIGTSSPSPTDGTQYLTFTETDVSGTGTIVTRTDYRRRSQSYVDGIADGNIFKITFDYYAPSVNGFDRLHLQPLNMLANGAVAVGDLLQINPITTTDDWVSFEMYWETDVVNFDGIDLRIQWYKNGVVSDTTEYFGHIDNLVIQQGTLVQIPEPSTLALLVFGCAMISRKRIKVAGL